MCCSAGVWQRQHIGGGSYSIRGNRKLRLIYLSCSWCGLPPARQHCGTSSWRGPTKRMNNSSFLGERRCESSAQAITERERSRKGRDRQQGPGKVICRVRRTGSYMLRFTIRKVELLNIFVRSNLLKSRGTGHDVYLRGWCSSHKAA